MYCIVLPIFSLFFWFDCNYIILCMINQMTSPVLINMNAFRIINAAIDSKMHVSFECIITTRNMIIECPFDL